jgi:hypothetical protein
MLNIVDVKNELEFIHIDRRNRPVDSDLHIPKLAEWAMSYGDQLVELAKLGYELSRIAACSEKRNQVLFLRGLFEKVTELQAKITDGNSYMQRDMPDPEEM